MRCTQRKTKSSVIKTIQNRRRRRKKLRPANHSINTNNCSRNAKIKIDWRIFLRFSLERNPIVNLIVMATAEDVKKKVSNQKRCWALTKWKIQNPTDFLSSRFTPIQLLSGDCRSFKSMGIKMSRNDVEQHQRVNKPQLFARTFAFH